MTNSEKMTADESEPSSEMINSREESTPTMSLWIKTKQLPNQYWAPISSCYEDARFPLEVRDVMSDWLECQDWNSIDENNPSNEAIARTMLNNLLQEMESRSMNLNNDYFSTKLKVGQAIVDFQRIYSPNPLLLVHSIKKCLTIEQNYVNMNEGNCELPSSQLYETGEKMIVLEELKDATKRTGDLILRLQEDQEVFNVEFQEYKTMTLQADAFKRNNETPRERLQTMQENLSKMCLKLKNNQQTILNKFEELKDLHPSTFEKLKTLTMEVLQEDLVKWKRKQQLHGTTPEMEENIRDIQKRCSILAKLIWENRQQIKKADQLHQRLRQSNLYPNLDNSITELLSHLVTSTFIVQIQPAQILKKDAGRFSATVTLLVGKALNINMNLPDVKAMLISEQDARQSSKNEPGNNETMGEIVNNVGKMEIAEKDFLSVRFRNMQLKKIKRTERRSTEAVTEEKFAILFKTEFKVGGEDLKFSTLSNPVVVTVHGNQECKAMATILWDNHFAEPNRMLFQVPDQVHWSDCAKMLSEKFKTDVGISLKPEDTNYLATKLFNSSPDEDFSRHVLTWSQFCKENMREKSFTFWEWFYAIVKLTKDHLHKFYKDNLIAGFIAKDQAQQMLSPKRCGTFLLRFSDNLLGGITIAWISQDESGKMTVWNLKPYDHKALSIRSLEKRIHDLKMLIYLYPDTVKSDAFPKIFEEDDDNEPMTRHGYVPNSLIDSVPGMDNNNCPLNDSMDCQDSPMPLIEDLILNDLSTDYSVDPFSFEPMFSQSCSGL
ncbi:signal transducer and activator of transcription 5B isoform X2 [Octopus sinensis]|uniref:Signal transducer and activator of transcription n=1 Tax=Octopus sinensis TaxID=2607531 RepID=A0A7E6FEK7_9MOLL|nr:signal transducer and activator of transcription 5B isoform X2 [Octopus sinensis]